MPFTVNNKRKAERRRSDKDEEKGGNVKTE
jgi:hypothetical protein